MKIIILSLLLFFTISYKRERAVEYARKYCKTYNPAYINYSKMIGDSTNFVSQCLIAGGLSFDGCAGRDVRGSIPVIANLKTCLSKKGWKNTNGLNNNFKDGYPFFYKKNWSYIATAVIGKKLKACTHDYEIPCDVIVNETEVNNFQYFYL